MSRFVPRWAASFCTAAVLAFLLNMLPDDAHAQTIIPNATDDPRVAALFFGVLMGMVMAAAAYLFFIWVAVRDRGQVFLLIFLLCIGANIVCTNELLMGLMGIYDPFGREFLSNVTIISSWVFGLYFAYYFLDLDTISPRFKIPFMLVAAVLLFTLIFSLIDRNLVHFLMPLLGTLTISVILIAGVVGIRTGTSGSLVYILAFACFLIGALTEPAYILGIIKTPQSQHNATYGSFALSAMMFAIVVASQFAARQEEKERALAISNERFMLATRGANEGLFDWNLVTGEIFLSDQFRKILGIRILSGVDGMKKWFRMIVPADRKLISDAVRRFRRTSKTNTLNVEYRVTLHDGEKRWLHSKAVAMRDKNTNRILRMVGSTSDITSRKQGEVALRASELRFRSITEAHPVPVLIVSLTTGSILYATPGAEQLLGMKQEDLQRRHLEHILPDNDVRAKLAETIIVGQPVDLMETEILRGDMQRIAAAVSARRISYQNESAMVMGLYDLTERRKAEAQIERQQEALQQSEKMAALGGLLAGVAHELNNPLSVVVGQATLLMEGSPEPKVATRAEKIFKAADRCSRIVKSFLALARRKPPERKPVDLNQVTRSSLELLGYQLKTGEITLQSELDDHLPPMIGDGDQLTQVVTNLVLNAAQAMENWQGKKQILIASKRDTTGAVLLSISDTGPGIPAEIRSRVFEPFFTTKSSKGGTGVGLALCVNIVAAHEGELQLTETQGGGATFTMKFPAAVIVEGDNSLNTSPLEQHLNRLKILLVDDEVELAQTLADLLEPEGHHIEIAANGAIAMDKLRKNSFDAIVSDLRMPVMDGPALYATLQQELPSYLNRIIYVTGDTLSTHVQNFLGSHTVPLVEKPYRLKDIRKALADLLDKLPATNQKE